MYKNTHPAKIRPTTITTHTTQRECLQTTKPTTITTHTTQRECFKTTHPPNNSTNTNEHRATPEGRRAIASRPPPAGFSRWINHLYTGSTGQNNKEALVLDLGLTGTQRAYITRQWVRSRLVHPTKDEPVITLM